MSRGWRVLGYRPVAIPPVAMIPHLIAYGLDAIVEEIVETEG
jgi:hypothetical protein